MYLTRQVSPAFTVWWALKNLAIGILPLTNTKTTGSWANGVIHWSNTVGKYPKAAVRLALTLLFRQNESLKKKTGLIADNYRELCRMHTSNSVCDRNLPYFLATGLLQSEAEPKTARIWL